MKVIDRFITRRIDTIERKRSYMTVYVTELITLFSILTFTFDCNYESVQFESRTHEGIG